MRHYEHGTAELREEEVAAAQAEFDKVMEERIAEDPEAALVSGDWKRGIDRRAYGRKAGPRGKRATNDIQQLWQDHKTIIDLKGTAGLKNKEIAEAVGCTPAKVSQTLNSTLGQQRLAAINAIKNAETIDVMKEVTGMLPQAVAVYAEVLASEESTINQKLRVADTLVMKISGHEAAKKLDVRSTSFKAEDLMELTNRGVEYAKRAGIVVEAEEVKLVGASPEGAPGVGSGAAGSEETAG